MWIVDHAARGVSIENVLKRYRFAAIIYYVRFLLNGAFFYLCILYLTKKYLLPDKSTFFIGLPLLLLAYLINHKKRQSNGRNFLVCIATADLRTDLEYGKSFMG